MQREALSGQRWAGATGQLQAAEGPACDGEGSMVHPAAVLESDSLGSADRGLSGWTGAHPLDLSDLCPVRNS